MYKKRPIAAQDRNQALGVSGSYFFFIAFEKEKITRTIPSVIKKLKSIKMMMPNFDSESNNVNNCCMVGHSSVLFYDNA